MSDYASGLPIRSESDSTDNRVHVKIVDGTNPSINQVSVDSDKNLHSEVHGNDPAGVDKVLRLSEIGALTSDGVYHATNNTKPGNTGLVLHTRNATPGDAQQGLRATGIQNSTVISQDVAIRDEAGAAFSESNPLPVTLVDSEGTEVNDFSIAAAIAANGTSTHDYTVTAGKTLKLSQIESTASGKAKIEVAIETAVASGIFTSKFVLFNSTATPNMSLRIVENIAVAAGVRVRVTRTNKDNQPQDLYSTISGHEI